MPESIFANDPYYSDIYLSHKMKNSIELTKNGSNKEDNDWFLSFPDYKVSEYILSKVCPAEDKTLEIAKYVQEAKDKDEHKNQSTIDNNDIPDLERLTIKEKPTKVLYLSYLKELWILNTRDYSLMQSLFS